MKVTLLDNFKNLVANLGTARDKQSHGVYALSVLPAETLSIIYRTSWMGRKVVDIPAKDATRKWREWHAETADIKDVEVEEKRLKMQQKTLHALQVARLCGGAVKYFSIKGQNPEEPLEVETVKKGALDFITVFDKQVLTAGDIDSDPLSEFYGLPEYFAVSAGTATEQRIHPSRLAIFIGAETLIDPAMSNTTETFGDSVLQAAYEAIRNADSVASNSASLIYEAKVDVLQIPGLADIMANDRQRQLLVDRVELSGQLKGNNGMMVIDGEEKYEQKHFTFGGIPDIGYQALQAVSGAADIPLTRFLGQSPAGLSSTGESDLKNYYDAVNSTQALTMTPALERLDECLIRSALGNRPDDIDYSWRSLWQMTDEQKSKISKEVADTIKTLADSGLFHEDDLAPAAESLLVEHSILPSFEITEHEEEEEPEMPIAPVIAAPVVPAPEEDDT